jgi:hypothetical protein
LRNSSSESEKKQSGTVTFLAASSWANRSERTSRGKGIGGYQRNFAGYRTRDLCLTSSGGFDSESEQKVIGILNIAGIAKSKA